MSKNKKFKADPTFESFSKDLRGLKFMQRAQKEAESKQKLEALGGSQKPQYVITQQSCERLRFGRFSFKGMNPEIENLMDDKNANIEEQK